MLAAPESGKMLMNTPDIIIVAVGLASLSVPVMLAFVLNTLRDLRQEINSLHKDISGMSTRLGRIEGRLFNADNPSLAP